MLTVITYVGKIRNYSFSQNLPSKTSQDLFDLDPGFQINQDFNEANAFLASLSRMLGANDPIADENDKEDQEEFVDLERVQRLAQHLRDLLIADEDDDDWFLGQEVSAHNSEVLELLEALEAVMERAKTEAEEVRLIL